MNENNERDPSTQYDPGERRLPPTESDGETAPGATDINPSEKSRRTHVREDAPDRTAVRQALANRYRTGFPVRDNGRPEPRNDAEDAEQAESPFGDPPVEQSGTVIVRMRAIVVCKLYETIGRQAPERGGVFVGKDPLVVEDWVFDEPCQTRGAVYYPTVSYLNPIIEKEHEPFGRQFIGVGHSHPAGIWHPSGDEHWGDVKAARNNLLSNGNSHLTALFIPIIESEETTGQFRIHPFVMFKKRLRVRRAKIVIEN